MNSSHYEKICNELTDLLFDKNTFPDYSKPAPYYNFDTKDLVCRIIVLIGSNKAEQLILISTDVILYSKYEEQKKTFHKKFIAFVKNQEEAYQAKCKNNPDVNIPRAPWRVSLNDVC